MFNRILIVCIGNICRSPTAEHLLKVALSDDRFSVTSAGLGALVDKPLEPTALALLEGDGQAPAVHHARQLTPAMLREADLVLTMEHRHLQAIHDMAPDARGKAFLLGKWQDNREIPDPYRQGEAAFVHALALIKEAVTAWKARIAPTPKA